MEDVTITISISREDFERWMGAAAQAERERMVLLNAGRPTPSPSPYTPDELLHEWIVNACEEAVPDPNALTDEQWSALAAKLAERNNAKAQTKSTKRKPPAKKSKPTKRTKATRTRSKSR